MESRNQAKRSVVQAMLELGNVRLGVNTSCGGVVLPERLMPRDYVVLDVGADVPMFNLLIDSCGLAATLSFDECPFDVFVPWASIFAISTDRGDLSFHEEAPQALLVDAAFEQQAVACGGMDSVDGVDAFDADVPTQPTQRTRPDWLHVVP